MKNLRRNFERLCFRNRDKGIPNLMLWIAVGNVLVYLLSLVDPSGMAYQLLAFDRSAILHGQVWRLFSYVFIPESSRILFFAIMLVFYVQIGRFMEAQWGRFKFSLYYLCGVVMLDIAALLLNCTASVYYLNISLILSFATMIPENRVILFFIIPLKMKYLAWFYFALTIVQVLFTAIPYNLFPVFALLNYLLFFGKDILNVLPRRQLKMPRSTFTRSGSAWAQQPPKAAPNAGASSPRNYRHKCTVCGRTDTDYPGLEFRYCSRCKGYYCYCMEHINNHEHIQ